MSVVYCWHCDDVISSRSILSVNWWWWSRWCWSWWSVLCSFCSTTISLLSSLVIADVLPQMDPLPSAAKHPVVLQNNDVDAAINPTSYSSPFASLSSSSSTDESFTRSADPPMMPTYRTARSSTPKPTPTTKPAQVDCSFYCDPTRVDNRHSRELASLFVLDVSKWWFICSFVNSLLMMFALVLTSFCDNSDCILFSSYFLFSLLMLASTITIFCNWFSTFCADVPREYRAPLLNRWRSSCKRPFIIQSHICDISRRLQLVRSLCASWRMCVELFVWCCRRHWIRYWSMVFISIWRSIIIKYWLVSVDSSMLSIRISP